MCLLNQAAGRNAHCLDDGQAGLPVPIILRQQLNDSLGDPRLAAVLEASYSAFEDLQSKLRQPDNTLLKDLAWLR